MFTVYILQGRSGRHYIGQTANFDARLEQHRRGHTHTTRRLGGDVALVVKREYPTRDEALAVEKMLKCWKSPVKAIDYLRRLGSDGRP